MKLKFGQTIRSDKKRIPMEIVEKGEGPVFTNPDPDRARAFFRKKSRIKQDKTMLLDEAVKTFVNDGDYLGIGGFGANRTPMAACHEIVRQKKKEPGFCRPYLHP